MNKYVLSFLVVTTLQLNAQVGINTSVPKTTLDVVGQPTTTSVFDGIIPPRITGNQLQAKTYTAAQNGAIVYATQSCSSPSGQVINVINEGFYGFNSTLNQWVALSNSTSKNVYCNNDNPNNATVFDDTNPLVTHDPSLTQNTQNSYYGPDGSSWIWNGTAYITYRAPMNVGERISILKYMPNYLANGTALSGYYSGALNTLIILDNMVRVDLLKDNNAFYRPGIVNITTAPIVVKFQTFATQSNQNRKETNYTIPATGTNYVGVDGDDLVDWSSNDTEIVTTNIILPNGKWYEIQWFAYEVGSLDPVKYIYMTALRKF